MLIKKISTSILFCCLVSSCTSSYYKNLFQQTDSSANDVAEIRIVDLNGKYRPTTRHVPALNSQLIQQQRNQQVRGKTFGGATSNNEIIETTDAFGDDFGPSRAPLVEQEQREAPIEYSMNNNTPNFEYEEEIILESEKQRSFKPAAVKPAKGIFVQIGVYSSKSSANSVLKKGQKFSDGFIKEIRRNNKTINKILLGPVKNDNQAKILLRKVKQNGFKDAFITKIQ